MSLSFRLDVGDVPLVRALKLSSRVYYGCKPWNPNLLYDHGLWVLVLSPPHEHTHNFVVLRTVEP